MEGTSAAAGKQFAADLRAIREERELTIDDLHEESKIPRSLIASFEETALFDHPMFNRVYLRSFVRTYAEWIDVVPEEALEGLDEALEGQYAGRLRKVYLEGVPPEEVAPTPGERDVEPTPVQDAEGPEKQTPEGNERTEEQDEPPSSAGAAAGAAASGTAQREQTRPGRSSLQPTERGSQGGARGTVRAGASSREAAWTAQSPPGGASRQRPSRSTRRGSSRRSSRSNTMAWVAVGAGVLVAGAILLLVLDAPEGADVASPQVQPAADTAASAEGADVPPPADVEIGRMIDLAILATDEGGGVQSLRLTRDSDLRRPYWIESGAVTVFPAEERIIIENPLDGRNEFDDLRLFVEGYEYPKNRRDDRGRIVITRERAEAFLQTVRGAPVRFTVTPDTNRIPVPQ